MRESTDAVGDVGGLEGEGGRTCEGDELVTTDSGCSAPPATDAEVEEVEEDEEDEEEGTNAGAGAATTAALEATLEGRGEGIFARIVCVVVLVAASASASTSEVVGTGPAAAAEEAVDVVLRDEEFRL